MLKQFRYSIPYFLMCFVLFLVVLQFYNMLAYSWNDYKKQFNKTYSIQRESVYKASFEAAIKYIENVNSMNLTYKLGPTKWSDAPLEQIRNVVRINMNDVANVMKKSLYFQNNLQGEIPKFKDWVKEGKVSDVKDQGGCGSCWAFVTSSVFQSILLINNNTKIDISIQYLTQCTNQSNCDGGYVNKAMSLALKTGLPTQTKYPYLSGNNPNTSVQGICAADSSLIQLASDTKTQSHYNLSVTETKQLLLKAPYAALISADYGFMNYKSGIYYCNYSVSRNDLNHAVTVVGYDSDGNLMIKNSWGDDWGSNGFGWISANSSQNCGINLYSYSLSSSTFVSVVNKSFQVNLFFNFLFLFALIIYC